MIEIGEYIRTKTGEIAKVLAYQDLTTYTQKGIGVTFHSFDTHNGAIANIDIAKHSKNIIDLIEVGDYVNGILITDIYINQEKEVWHGASDFMDEICLKNKDIKSIVTKEQFESMKYEVEK